MSHPASQTFPCSRSPIGLCESVSGAGVKAPECVQESALIYVSEDAALSKKRQRAVPALHSGSVRQPGPRVCMLRV